MLSNVSQPCGVKQTTCFQTLMAGAQTTAQVLLAEVVTRLLQTSCPVAFKISVRKQTFVGTGSVPLKVTPWPGSSLEIVVTGVLAAGWLFTITIFVMETLPVLVIVPLNPSTPP